LKPGGVHCFTIPYCPSNVTRARIDVTGPHDVDLLPRVYHQDPYRPEDALVYTDFGSDLISRLQPIGFQTQEHNVWDSASDIRDDMNPMRVFLSVKTERARNSICQS
jgi:hypothetical protein